MSKKYHVNPDTGEARECRAARSCRFGSQSEHYSTVGEAAAAYESANASNTVTTLNKSDARIRELRDRAVDIAGQMNADPEWLPPIDDPEAPDGIPEEEAWVTSMEKFKDPSIAMGSCGVVAESVSMFTSGELKYVEHEVYGPYLNVHAANILSDEYGVEWVVDYTYSQIDPSAEWPHVARREDWERAVESAGFEPAEEVRRSLTSSAQKVVSNWVQWNLTLRYQSGQIMWRFNDETSEKASFQSLRNLDSDANKVSLHTREKYFDKWEELQGVNLNLALELLSSQREFR